MKDKKKLYRELAKMLTEIDELGPKSLKYKYLLEPKHMSLRIGITGPPGAGKSTLIAGMIGEFSRKGLSVAVLAVDPSSPFSQGALLGDRIRYQEALSEHHVFVRSIGSRGSPGGLSSSSYLMLRAFDHFQFDIVLIETVGVGQTELEIMNVADITAVVLVPESGDGIQMMKAGLMEIADIFIVNKSDRPGAQSLIDELKTEVSFQDKKNVQIFSTVASENKGVAEICQKLAEGVHNQKLKAKRLEPLRLQSEAKALMRFDFERDLTKKVAKIKTNADLKKLFI